jgi:hypothetical protein
LFFSFSIRDEDARLREQQNQEYQAMIENERRERERIEREDRERMAAEEAKRQAEEEAAAIELSRQLAREDNLRKIRTIFSSEIEPKAGEGVSTLRFQLPKGKKITRKFFKHEKVQVILLFGRC